jgi:hypothetical protein
LVQESWAVVAEVGVAVRFVGAARDVSTDPTVVVREDAG